MAPTTPLHHRPSAPFPKPPPAFKAPLQEGFALLQGHRGRRCALPRNPLPDFNRWAGGQRVTLDQAPQHYNSTPAVDGLHDSSRASPFCALSQTPSHILGALAGGVCALRKPGRGETLRDPSSGQTASLGAFRESEGKPGQGETLRDPSSGQYASLMAFREGVAQTRSRRNLARPTFRSKCIPGCV